MQVLTLRLPPKGLQASSSKMSSGDDTFNWYCHQIETEWNFQKDFEKYENAHAVWF